jgi:hypothetical protein
MRVSSANCSSSSSWDSFAMMASFHYFGRCRMYG